MKASERKSKSDRGGKESTYAWAKAKYLAHPRLLRKRSNEAIYRMWLEENPDAREVPDKIKVRVANVKNQLRHKKKTRRRGGAEGDGQNPAPAAAARHRGALVRLEERLDTCLMLARQIDADRLARAIKHLREARNEVVRKSAG